VNSLKQIAGIYFSIKKFQDAKGGGKSLPSSQDPGPRIHGVINWTLAHEDP
jgi:hypothetical protein